MTHGDLQQRLVCSGFLCYRVFDCLGGRRTARSLVERNSFRSVRLFLRERNEFRSTRIACRPTLQFSWFGRKTRFCGKRLLGKDLQRNRVELFQFLAAFVISGRVFIGFKCLCGRGLSCAVFGCLDGALGKNRLIGLRKCKLGCDLKADCTLEIIPGSHGDDWGLGVC
jgi:hypothetical protein